MSARRACVACRARKVKCNPVPGQACERCTEIGLEDCAYEPRKKRGIGKTLRMGAACKFCRSKKRKCDGKRPCTRCVAANKPSECEYDVVDFPPGLLAQPQMANEPESSASGALSLELWGAGNTAPGSSITTHVAISKPAPEAGRRRPYPITLPPFSALFPLIPPKIPPEPRVTLLSLGAERFQLSYASLGELDMKFRLRGLYRLDKLGIRFPSKKQQALLRGDSSGTAIHPYFIQATQALGMYYCEGMDDSPAMVRLQAIYVQMGFELLAGIFKGDDWELRAQVALWTAAASFALSGRNPPMYMEKVFESINTARLQFVPTYGRPPELSEALREKSSVLSQAIYLENFLFLTCGGAEPTMTARIEKEFRFRLLEVYPALLEICPLTMRTKAILLVRDTVLTLYRRPTDEVHAGIWRQSCDQLMILLDGYSQTLLSNLRRFEGLCDEGGAELIRGCCIVCFAHLAVLCEALGELEPAPQTGVDTLCDASLERVGELSGVTCMEEYTHYDRLLGVSWKKALEVFDARLAKITSEHGINLRHWKQIVEKHQLDFARRIPEAKMPTLAVRARREDGRTEGSQYPNLILPWERNHYGL
ncbi:hypothetical protein BJ322DRAFT_831444 [Thelephora terrestris]|uniref:Zn(2)-C6 fungal-type domain-containing protein n=1 Tax=Thelephora terrestris TaxID=56493 RepID=A0A9P6L7F2_9AGAM|nr:hypothetical protein BJ322DRAFT_831444 [Thelephora terrestris]